MQTRQYSRGEELLANQPDHRINQPNFENICQARKGEHFNIAEIATELPTAISTLRQKMANKSDLGKA